MNAKEFSLPAIMGIWNVSPDSFSSKYDSDESTSIAHALRLCREGADLLDIGAESTRPGADPVSSQIEIERLSEPLGWAKRNLNCPISLDSYQLKTIEWALSNEYIDIVNDIGVSEDPCEEREGRLYGMVREAGVRLIVMAWNAHSSPEQPWEACLKKIVFQLTKRIEFAVKNGVDPHQIIVDPGIGFGKGLDNDLMLIWKAPAALKHLGCPVLIGHSRKRCIAKAIGTKQELDMATAMASAMAFSHGASIVRVHEPRYSVMARQLTTSPAFSEL